MDENGCAFSAPLMIKGHAARKKRCDLLNSYGNIPGIFRPSSSIVHDNAG